MSALGIVLITLGLVYLLRGLFAALFPKFTIDFMMKFKHAKKMRNIGFIVMVFGIILLILGILL